jgi:uncharacterized protein (DUF2147 family)
MMLFAEEVLTALG